MKGLPQSRPCENVQSSVRMSPAAPAARARSTRASIASRVPAQYICAKVFGLAATTSSIPVLARPDKPRAVPRAAAARATPTSATGCTAWTPTGERITGNAMSTPMTVVDRSRSCARPATCGAKPSSENAATLSSSVRPRSVPARIALNTELGSVRFARRSASATLSNHGIRPATRHRDA